MKVKTVKHRAIYFGILLSIIFMCISHSQQDDFPVLRSQDFGQKSSLLKNHILACEEFFTIGNKAFSSLQSRNSGIKIKWEKRLPMPGHLYAFDAVTIDNKIYAVGGRGNEEGYHRNFYQYDLGKNQWEIKKELIFDRANHAVVALGGKIYVFGGNDNPSKSEVFDPHNNSWEELADMPTPRQHINYSAAAVNGKIYVIGGIEKRSEREYIITDKNEEYDPATNTWKEKAPLPAPRQIPAVVSFQNKIYAISGTDSKWEDQSTVFLYHPEKDSWESRAQMPEARYINGVAVVKNRIIILTGIRSDYKISKIFVYDPELNRWHYLGELPLNFMLAGVTSAKDKLYVLGGSTHDHILSACWEADITLPPIKLKE